MKIAVLTPYFNETDEELLRCMESVKAQTIPCTHVMVADGRPNPLVDAYTTSHLTIPNHNDYGDTPRLIGSCHVFTAGYDALVYLDGDNYFSEDHIENLVKVQERTGAAVITCGRTLRTLDDEVLGVCPETDGVNFVDTNCLFLTRRAFPYTAAWGFKDKRLGIVGDRIFWNAIKASGLPIVHVPENGVQYVTDFGCHYVWFDRTPPLCAKQIVGDGVNRRILNFWDAHPHLERPSA